MKYFEEKKIGFKKIIGVLSILALCLSESLPVMAYTVDSYSEEEAVLEYTLKGLSYARTVQNFYIDQQYMYVSQQYIDYENNAYSTIISRCLISENNKTATYMDHMTLFDFGHGETLDMVDDKNKKYLLIGCKRFGLTDAYLSQDPTVRLSDEFLEGKDLTVATELARVEYVPWTTVYYDDVPKIKNMNFGNKTGTEIGVGTRMFGMYTGAKEYVFRIQTVARDTGYVSVTYSTYDGRALNLALDNGDVDLATMTKYCKKSFLTFRGNIVRPYFTVQGVEMKYNGGTYVAGNNVNSGNAEELPQIAKTNRNGKCIDQRTISNLLNSDEIEGLKMKNGRLYFNVIKTADYTDDNWSYFKRYEQKIYSVDAF